MLLDGFSRGPSARTLAPAPVNMIRGNDPPRPPCSWGATRPPYPWSADDGGELFLDLRRRRIGQRGAVGEQDSGHGLVAAVYRHHELGRGLRALDVDLDHLDPFPGQLPLQVAAIAAPRGGVHRQLAGHPLPP